MNKASDVAQDSLLIVSNTKDYREILLNVFESQYCIKQADNSIDAFKIMRSDTIIAVLCDMKMPKCEEFIIKICRDNESFPLPIFAFTTEEDEAGQIKALDLGVEDVITIPVKSQIALARVKNSLENRRSQLDPLTGLYSSDMFCREAARMITGKPAGTYLLACFDIDNFKAINAQYGRETGDYVLKETGNIIGSFVETFHGIAGYISADNYAMLLPSDTPALLPKLMMSLEDVLKNNGTYIKFQLSIGRYLIDDKSLSFNDMIGKAFLAKRTVKGCYNVSVATYNEEIQERFIKEQKIISQMDYALADGQFEAWLQPQYNHETGDMVGAEALTRWRSKNQGTIIHPDIFIPVFERNGFIYELDKYILEQVCKHLRRWLDEGKNPIPISVNISRVDIFQEDFYDNVTKIVEKYSISTELLQLEITESAFSFDSAKVIKIVKKLQDYGFIVEIDDFGSGYSSFNVLKDVPADVLKLDMRFLSDKDSTGRGGNIIESIVRMAKWIGMKVIAEGVETQKQADFLCSIGCPFV